jgi:hypothetical protein
MFRKTQGLLPRDRVLMIAQGKICSIELTCNAGRRRGRGSHLI